MKKYFLLTILIFISFFILHAQRINKAADDAFIITRMAEKFHVQPRPVNKEFSANWFDELIKQLDEDKTFFTKDDINKLQVYRLQLDNEVLNKKTGFLQLLVTIYQQRLQQADTMIDNICKQPFYFNTNEKITVAEDTLYPANISAQRIKFSKHIRATALSALLEANEDLDSLNVAQKKKAIDTMEIFIRKRIHNSYKRAINRMLQSPGGLEQAVCTEYCQALTVCYDPHSDFFPPTEKENFESHLGNAPLQFGFKLNEDDDGDVVIDNLKPGSPAFKSGQLNKGDKIQTIQWEGKEPIDVSGASPAELNQMLGANNHEKLTLTIKKADGTISHVSLVKEKAETGDDDNKVKSFLLKGKKIIGFISLPAFYTDWDTNNKGVNGCADDVAKEIVKLKKENIDGLIIDLRYNGGGSMEEAVDLSGIFIDAGPVAQIKSREAKAYTLKDANRGTIYDGPLILMVNGYSASASEMVAGTLQDYNRALIVGSPTYGKATAQVVLPMDTTIKLDEDLRNKQADSYIKLTIEKLYRINGSSAQAKGVVPDIQLPDLLEANPNREVNNPLAFGTSSIEPNKYYKPYAALPVAALQAYAKTQADSSSYFKSLKFYITEYKKHQQPKDISLNWNEALAERKKDKDALLDPPEFNKTNNLFSVTNHAFEEQRLKTDSDLRELDETWKERLLKDPYIQIAFGLLSYNAK
jgi:carboxyl-terminal processing protease